jgi:hypothetical protein
MSSLFDKMPGMNNVRNAAVGAVNSVNKLTPSGGIGNVIIYVLLILIIILIYLLLTGYKFSIKTFDIRPKKYKALDNAQVYWKSGMGGVNNLRITENEGLSHDLNSKYTYHIDILLTNTRNISNIEGPYRHIFHRGSSELYNDETIIARGGSAPQLPPYGLPKRLNPGIFLDPNTNDIIVFVDTKSKSGDVYRESGRISDIPVDKPLRLTVTVHNKVLEINLNCKLELTKVLAGEPKTVENVVYGLCGNAAAQASLQNLFIWPYALDNGILVDFCPMPFPPFKPSTNTCRTPTDPSLKSGMDAATAATSGGK